MADEPFEDGFRLQMEKGLWIRLDRAPAVRPTRSQLGGIRAVPIACARLSPRHPE